MRDYSLPDFIDYPEFFDVEKNFNLFNNVYSFIIKPYDVKNGYSLYLGFRDEYSFIRLSDFKSHDIKLSDVNKMTKYPIVLFNIMRAAKIKESCFYFSNINDPILVDVMISANKFLSPGMVKDLFSKTIPTQEIHEISILNNDFKKFKGMIVKPSNFKYIVENNYFRPLYGVI